MGRPVKERGRPDADLLLARVREEEARTGRGRLKIFLGYAAGVGKTYAMLEAAHERQRDGGDVVIGWVDTHGRPETEALLEGLTLLPRRSVPYRGVELQDLDLDGLLARKPALALVDELAHTNAPGSRHRKRWADIEELLAAGIDVYTAMNVQHLESLNDVVARITGVQVRETVPDRVLDAADEIELVDLPPEDLLIRLQQGKVYVPTTARHAMQGFFRPEKLTALREVVLRRAADRVDEQVRSYMELLAIPGPWPARERLLVCVGPSPYGRELVRGCARLAQSLHACWEAVFVETPEGLRAAPEAEARVDAALALAESLGGRAVRLAGEDVAAVLMEHARRSNATKLIVGKPPGPWNPWRPQLVDRILAASGPVDVYVITAERRDEPRPALRALRERGRDRSLRVAKAVLLVAAATALGSVLDMFFHITNLVMIYLLVVMIAALWWGRTPAIAAAFLSVLAFDFFFVPPRYTFSVSDTSYLLTFATLFLVGFVVANLAARQKELVEVVRGAQQHTMAAYEFSQVLARAVDSDAVVDALVENLRAVVPALATVFESRGGSLEVHPRSPVPHVRAEDVGTATWVCRHGQPAGRGTDTLPAQGALFLPMATAGAVVGVLRLELQEPLRPSQRRLVEGIASQTAVALERLLLAEEAKRAEVLSETERLQSALLDSISHDLQTPIASILGCLDSMKDTELDLDRETVAGLLSSARAEAGRLQRLVENLLEMTRVEGGAAQLHLELCEVQDLVGTALRQVEPHHPQREVGLDLPAELPMVRVDFVLLVQVLVNLLENAFRYAPRRPPIRVCAGRAGAFLRLEVVDHGPGIPEADRLRVFDKFYRVHRPEGGTGTGLGLAICKGLVEAHGGRIEARETPGGGATMRVEIPVEEEP